MEKTQPAVATLGAAAHPSPLLLNAMQALILAEAALSDIGDADREPGDDLAWCEARAALAIPACRKTLAELKRAIIDDARIELAGPAAVAWYDPENKDPGQSVTFSRERHEKWPHIYKVPLYERSFILEAEV